MMYAVIQQIHMLREKGADCLIVYATRSTLPELTYREKMLNC